MKTLRFFLAILILGGLVNYKAMAQNVYQVSDEASLFQALSDANTYNYATGYDYHEIEFLNDLTYVITGPQPTLVLDKKVFIRSNGYTLTLDAQGTTFGPNDFLITISMGASGTTLKNIDFIGNTVCNGLLSLGSNARVENCSFNSFNDGVKVLSTGFNFNLNLVELCNGTGLLFPTSDFTANGYVSRNEFLGNTIGIEVYSNNVQLVGNEIGSAAQPNTIGIKIGQYNEITPSASIVPSAVDIYPYGPDHTIISHNRSDGISIDCIKESLIGGIDILENGGAGIRIRKFADDLKIGEANHFDGLLRGNQLGDILFESNVGVPANYDVRIVGISFGYENGGGSSLNSGIKIDGVVTNSPGANPLLSSSVRSRFIVGGNANFKNAFGNLSRAIEVDCDDCYFSVGQNDFYLNDVNSGYPLEGCVFHKFSNSTLSCRDNDFVGVPTSPLNFSSQCSNAHINVTGNSFGNHLGAAIQIGEEPTGQEPPEIITDTRFILAENFIGVEETNGTPLPCGGPGVIFHAQLKDGGAFDLRIERNTICSCSKGIVLGPIENYSDCYITDNFIGTNEDGLVGLGNTGPGVEIFGDWKDNRLQLAQNTIAGNGGSEVKVAPSDFENSQIFFFENKIGMTPDGLSTLSAEGVTGLEISDFSALKEIGSSFFQSGAFYIGYDVFFNKKGNHFGTHDGRALSVTGVTDLQNFRIVDNSFGLNLAGNDLLNHSNSEYEAMFFENCTIGYFRLGQAFEGNTFARNIQNTTEITPMVHFKNVNATEEFSIKDNNFGTGVDGTGQLLTLSTPYIKLENTNGATIGGAYDDRNVFNPPSQSNDNFTLLDIGGSGHYVLNNSFGKDRAETPAILTPQTGQEISFVDVTNATSVHIGGDESGENIGNEFVSQGYPNSTAIRLDAGDNKTYSANMISGFSKAIQHTSGANEDIQPPIPHGDRQGYIYGDLTGTNVLPAAYPYEIEWFYASPDGLNSPFFGGAKKEINTFDWELCVPIGFDGLVVVTITDNNGNTSELSQVVHVEDLGTDISFQTSCSMNSGFAIIEATNSTSGAVELEWQSFADGGSGVLSIPGNGATSVEVAEGDVFFTFCGGFFDYITVEPGQAPCQIEGADEVCVGNGAESFTVNNFNDPAYTYSWHFSGGGLTSANGSQITSSTTATVQVVFGDAPGETEILVAEIFKDGALFSTMSLSVDLLESPPIPTILSPQVVCVETEGVPLVATPEGGVFWKNGFEITEFSSESVGDVTLEYTLLYNNGCESATSSTVQVVPKPAGLEPPSIFIDNPCAPDLYFYALNVDPLVYKLRIDESTYNADFNYVLVINGERQTDPEDAMKTETDPSVTHPHYFDLVFNNQVTTIEVLAEDPAYSGSLTYPEYSCYQISEPWFVDPHPFGTPRVTVAECENEPVDPFVFEVFPKGFGPYCFYYNVDNGEGDTELEPFDHGDGGNGCIDANVALVDRYGPVSVEIQGLGCITELTGTELPNWVHLEVVEYDCPETGTGTGIGGGSGCGAGCKNEVFTSGGEYEVSVWAKEVGHTTWQPDYTEAGMVVKFHLIPEEPGDPEEATFTFRPTGDKIEGWQRIEGTVEVPEKWNGIGYINLLGSSLSGVDILYDDVKVFPKQGNVISYVYDPETFRLMAELDENNYATYYEYNTEGQLIRVKKETERGTMTLQENRLTTVKNF